MAKREMITPPNNSFAARGKTGAQESSPKAVPGMVKESKKSLGKKLAETFIKEDLGSVGSYILDDIIVPLIKDGIYNVFTQALDMLLFSRNGGGYRGGNGAKKSYASASYQGYYYGNNNRAKSDGVPTREFSEISFETRRLAQDVLIDMRAYLEQFPSISINDYHDIVEQHTGFCPSGSYTDADWGWTDLTHVDAKLNREGRYILTLPKAVDIRDK